MKEIDDSNWTTIIRPHRGLLDIDFKGIWSYRDLINLLVRRDFVAQYKQTILGPLWFILQPLFTTLVFTVVFGTIAKIPTDGLPPALFYLAGITVWNYFSSCLNQTSTTFVSNAAIFGKVYFPRLVMPISIIITNLLRFAIQFCFFLAFLLYYYLSGSIVHPNLWVLLTPILLIQMAALGLGVGIILSSLTIKYRDLTQALTFGVQLWMYATPIVYPLSQVPEKWQWIIALNPMTSIVEVFRYGFLGEGTIKLWFLGMSICITTLLLVLGIILFNRVEKTFIDTV